MAGHSWAQSGSSAPAESATAPGATGETQTAPEATITNVRKELTFATPEYIGLAYQNALESFYRQDYEGALVYIRHVIQADMKNYKLRYLAAHSHWKLGNFGPAAIHFQEAQKANPKNPGPYIDYSLLMIHQRRYNDGLRMAGRGLDYFKKNSINTPSKLYNVTARIKLLQGKPAEALIFAERAKGAFDQNTGIKDKLESMVLEARAQLALGEYDKAVFSLEWALSLKPGNPYIQNLLGHTYSSWYHSAQKQKSPKAGELKQKALDYFAQAKGSSEVAGFQKIVQQNIDQLNE